MSWPKLNSTILGLNLGLLLAVGYYFVTRTTPSEPIRASESPAPVAVSAMPTQVVEKVVTKTVTMTNDIRWRQLESEDYREYIARLRKIGCPEQTIRDLIIADLDKLYAPQVQALQGRRKNLKYWNSEEEELANNVNPRTQQDKERAIDQEKRKVVQELLGVDLVRERLKQKGQDDYYERRLSFLPEHKRGEVRQVLEEYDAQEQAIRNKEIELGEAISPTDKQALRKLEQERQAKLSGVLSDDEKTQLDLWMSPIANGVRHDLYGMNATEQEFQGIYQLRKGFDDRWGQVDPEMMDDAVRQQYAQAKAELETQLKQALGDQRYSEYQRGMDESFHQLSATVTRFNLPRQTAAQVYELKRTVQSMSAIVQADTRMNDEQKAKALKAITDETEREVRNLLGEAAFRYYSWRGQASWLGK